MKLAEAILVQEITVTLREDPLTLRCHSQRRCDRPAAVIIGHPSEYAWLRFCQDSRHRLPLFKWQEQSGRALMAELSGHDSSRALTGQMVES